MTGITYRRIRPDWHRLDTPWGVFFGYSEMEVRGRARRAEQARRNRREVS